MTNNMELTVNYFCPSGPPTLFFEKSSLAYLRLSIEKVAQQRIATTLLEGAISFVSTPGFLFDDVGIKFVTSFSLIYYVVTLNVIL